MTGAAATIARREAGALFGSPVAWILLAIMQGATAFIFLLHLDSYLQLQPQLARSGNAGITAFIVPRLFGAATTLYLLAVPLLTMNLIAGERRDATLPLLLSAPVSTTEIVLGKLAGVMSALVVMVALTAAMPAALAPFTDLDLAALGLATLGALLFVLAAASTGIYLSAMAPQPTVAAIATVGLLLLLLLLGEWGRQLGGLWAALLPYPAPSTHLEPFFTGLLDTGAIAFFVLFSALFITLAVRRLDNERVQR